MEKTKTQLTELTNKWTNRTPGFAISIVKTDGTEISHSCGIANLSYNIPIDEDTTFYLCSLSKQFTAACVAILIDEGKLSFENKLVEFFPELPEELYGKITISHLLHMTSGIHEWYDILEFSNSRFDRYNWRSSFIPILARQENLNFEPGKKYTYCNANYTLLVLIIEKITGINIVDFAERNLFKPAGMNSTFFCEDNNQVIPKEAIGHNKSGNIYKTVEKFPPLPGAGCVYSTLKDLRIWLKILINRSWRPEIIELLHSQINFNNGSPNPYLLGLEELSYKNRKFINHGGGVPGFSTYIGYLPEYKCGYIWLANHNDFNVMEYIAKMIDITTDTLDEEYYSSDNAPDFSHFTGEYINLKSLEKCRLTKDSDYSIEGQPTIYKHFMDTVLVDSSNFFNRISLRDYYNSQILRMISPDDDQFFVNRSALPDNYNINDYCGNYYSKELDVSWELCIKDEKLYVKALENFSETDLEIINQDIFLSPSKGIKLRFFRNEDSAVLSFMLDSFRAQNFLFRKVL